VTLCVTGRSTVVMLYECEDRFWRPATYMSLRVLSYVLTLCSFGVAHTI
jgi:hypothetical protein